jgi:hypothetical protein
MFIHFLYFIAYVSALVLDVAYVITLVLDVAYVITLVLEVVISHVFKKI